MAARSQSRQRRQNWVLGCGGNSFGELGLGGVDEHAIKALRSIPALERVRVKQIATGRNHTLVLTSTGHVLSCGRNEYGELGQNISTQKPEHVASLSSHVVVQVACGEHHSVVLSEAGQVFTWGAAQRGQLGHGTPEADVQPYPKLVKRLASFTVVQIAAGNEHCLALVNDGSLYAWGANQSGQLGLGKAGEPANKPVLIECLQELPLSQIVCGGQHSMALTKSGALFVWGSNRNGQLGLGDNKDRAFPTIVKPLRQHHIKYIDAGDGHSLALTALGGVFSFGCGTYGQLGHGSKNDQTTPKKILDLMGTTITQVAAGRCHSVCYAPGAGRVFTFGLGGSGQLGLSLTTCSVFLPSLLPGHFVQVNNVEELRFTNPSERNPTVSTTISSDSMERGSDADDSDDDDGVHWSQRLNDECVEDSQEERGHDSTVRQEADAFAMPKTGSSHAEGPVDMQVDDENLAVATPQDELIDKGLLVHSVFAGGDRTFLLCNDAWKNGNYHIGDYRIRPRHSEILFLDIDILETIPFLKKNETVPQDTMSYLEVVLSSPACLNGSFLLPHDAHYDCSGLNHGVDLELAQRAFKCLEDTKNVSLQEFIGAQFAMLVEKIGKAAVRPVDIEAIRIYILIPLCHLTGKIPEHLEDITNPFQRALLTLKTTASNIVSAWYAKFDEHVFGDFVRLFKCVIDYVFIYNKQDTISLELALKTLKRLNGINRAKHIVPFEEFYIEILTQHISIEKDYAEWQMSTPEFRTRHLFFSDYPFVFDAAAKTEILMTDAAIQKSTAVQQTMQQRLNPFAMIFRQQPVNPFLVLQVRRTHIIEDSLQQLSMKDCSDLRKPLKVVFSGEEAVDEGGVRKEFFMLLIREVLDPKFGMFRVHEDSNYIWFHPAYFSDDKQTFFLIGILCGLAIYNQTIIPLLFPLSLYKKLLKETLSLSDLRVLSPSTAKGLQALLDYTGDDLEDVFCLNFTVTRDNYGQLEEVELKEGGKEITVNGKNRQEYVKLYVDYIFNVSCREAFGLFSTGFYRVLNAEIVSMFNANELMTLVAGTDNYNWRDLELHTGYKEEYNPTHPVIRMFWKVFHQLSEAEKKQFLLFLTGTDRIPILGMGEIKMVIVPYKASIEHLPVAHTCINTLELPNYPSQKILKEKLVTAIAHNTGFGFR